MDVTCSDYDGLKLAQNTNYQSNVMTGTAFISGGVNVSKGFFIETVIKRSYFYTSSYGIYEGCVCASFLA